MRKIMKKKVNVFGKTVPVFVLVLLGIGLVSAALVASWGTITGSVVAYSPIEITSDIPDSVTMYGGGETIFDVTVTNLADGEITGIVKNLVTSAGVTYDSTEYYMTCDDFESVLAQTVSTYPIGVLEPNRVIDGCTLTSGTGSDTNTVRVYDCNEYDLILAGLCHVIEPGSASVDTVIQFGYGPNSATTNEVTYMSGQIDVTTITATFKVNTIGTYVFTSEVIPVL